MLEDIQQFVAALEQQDPTAIGTTVSSDEANPNRRTFKFSYNSDDERPENTNQQVEIEMAMDIDVNIDN